MADGVVTRILKIVTGKSEKALKETSDKVKGLGDQFDKTGKKGKGFTAELATKIVGVKAAFDMTAGAIGAFSDAIIGAGKAVYDLTVNVVDSINNLNDLATISGLTAQSVQGLQLAFAASGQAAGASEALIKRLPRIISEFDEGTSKAAKAAKQFGISVRDQAGDLKSADNVLMQVTRTLQNFEDPTQKAEAAALLLGRGAAGLIQAIGNSAPLEKFNALVEKFGVKTGPEASSQAAIFQARLSAVQVGAQGTSQAFLGLFGGMNTANSAMKLVFQSLAALTAVFTSGKSAIQLFGKALFDAVLVVGKKAFEVLGGSGLNQLKQFMVTLNEASKALTGIDLLGDVEGFFKKELDDFMEVSDINLMMDEAKKAFDEAGVALDELTAAEKKNREEQEKLAKALKQLLHDQKELEKQEKLKQEAQKRSIEQARRQEQEQRKIEKAVNKASKDVDNYMKMLAKAAEKTRKEQAKAIASFEKLNEKITEEELNPFESITKGAKDTLAQLKVLRDEFERLGLPTSKFEALNKALEEQTRILLVRQGIKTGAAAVGSIAGGPSAMVSQIGSAFGATGGAVAELINAFAQLGEKDPEEIKQEAKAFTTAVLKGVTMLPSILIEVLPSLLLDLANNIILAIYRLPFEIAAALARLFQNIVESIKNTFSFENLGNMVSDTVGFVLKPITDLFGGEKLGGGRFTLPSAQGGLRFTGNNQGLAMLHRNEFVVPQTGQAPQSIQNRLSGMGGGVTININAQVVENSAIDALVREIEQRFSAFGSSTSPLFL